MALCSEGGNTLATWSIKEMGGAPNRYFATKRREAVLDLQLWWNRADGRRMDLGRYRLPMAELATRGLVRERADGQGYDVQIRIVDGDPHFSLNQGHQMPMAECRV
jgi:hypothetical protein